MDIILSAFGGKLVSKPMEWPDNTGETVYLTLGMDNFFPSPNTITDYIECAPKYKKATFKWFGHYSEFIRKVRIYKLVDVS